LPVGINGRDVAQTPSGFLEIVSDDFPVFHARRNCASFAPPRLPPNALNTLHSSEYLTIGSCIVGGHHCVNTTFDGLPTAASVVLNEISASSDCARLNGAERR
jgi:hypothetical protein